VGSDVRGGGTVAELNVVLAPIGGRHLAARPYG
jgi:hypothetical protein